MSKVPSLRSLQALHISDSMLPCHHQNSVPSPHIMHTRTFHRNISIARSPFGTFPVLCVCGEGKHPIRHLIITWLNATSAGDCPPGGQRRSYYDVISKVVGKGGDVGVRWGSMRVTAKCGIA